MALHNKQSNKVLNTEKREYAIGNTQTKKKLF